MGFSTIGSFIIMFFAIMIMLSSAFLIYNSLVESTNTTAKVQQMRLENANTMIKIQGIIFDSATDPDTISINVSNEGSKKLDLAHVDVYIDGIKIPRNNANRTIGFAGENIINPLHWDPGEVLQINVSLNLENQEHAIAVSNEYGLTDTKGFTIP